MECFDLLFERIEEFLVTGSPAAAWAAIPLLGGLGPRDEERVRHGTQERRIEPAFAGLQALAIDIAEGLGYEPDRGEWAEIARGLRDERQGAGHGLRAVP